MKSFLVIASTSIKGLTKLEEMERYTDVFSYIKQNVDIDVLPVIGCYGGEIEQSMAFTVEGVQKILEMSRYFHKLDQECILVMNELYHGFLLSNGVIVKRFGKLKMHHIAPKGGDYTRICQHDAEDIYLYTE